ncbi:MAG: acyltransferase family protein [Pseudonocardia sp.]
MTARSEHRPENVSAPARSFRPELQGLRALAVTLVVVYHVWFNRVSGGVDVFLLVSGFLLTGQLARAAERGPLRLGQRWSRMLLRLLPAALTVLLATVLASVVALPAGRWSQTIREVAAAALFLENWQLAADSVVYAARTNTTSVVQHFWSLSIQGQLFLVWPLLIALVALMARGATARLHTQLTLAVLGLFAASLSFSIALTSTNQPLAYFHSLTRLWEFALGGLLALGVDRIALSRRMRIALGWLGVVGLVSCGMVLQGGNVFPGYAALWPTGCAALVLIAGTTGSRHGADRLLASRPAQYLGDLSYPLYLWHWPVLILYLATRDREQVGLSGGAVIIGASLVLAVLTHHLVEKPVLARSFSVRGGYRLAAAGLAAVLLATGGWQLATNQRAVPAGMVGDADHPGAQALVAASGTSAPLLPPAVSVFEDWVRIEYWDCTPMTLFPMDACALPVQGPGPPALRIVVVGDSHIQQLAGALVPIAQRHNWQLISIVRGACPFSTVSEVVPQEADCLAWNTAASATIAELQPDAVVTLATRDVRPGLTEHTPPGFVAQWWRLYETGIPVIAVRDNPRFDFSVPDCVQQHGRDAAQCGMDRGAVYAAVPPYAQLTDVPPNVSFLDVADAVCDPARCPAEIGNVMVYLDDNHLTASYASSMAGLVEERVVAALG